MRRWVSLIPGMTAVKLVWGYAIKRKYAVGQAAGMKTVARGHPIFGKHANLDQQLFIDGFGQQIGRLVGVAAARSEHSQTQDGRL